MEKRINISKLEPDAYKAMLQLEVYGSTCAISQIHKELIKMRASQINGCAYCLEMHIEDALKYGESQRRIDALSVWHESHLFTEEERILLQAVEEVTKISEKGLGDDTYKKCLQFFGEHGTAQIIMLIVTINAWNRIAISTRLIYKP